MQKQPKNSQKKQAKSRAKGGKFGGATTTLTCKCKDGPPENTGVYSG